MRIDRLHVRNFKGFEDRVFEFPRSIDQPETMNGSFHLIIGQNGKGKTSVLEALAVAAGSWFLGVRGEDSRHIQPGDVRVRIALFGDTVRLEKQLPVRVTAEGVVTGQKTKWTRELVGVRTKWIQAKSIKTAAETAVQQMQDGTPVTLPLISYYGTGRLWQEPRDVRAQREELIGTEETLPFQESESSESSEDLAEAFSSRLAGYRYSIDPRCSPRDLLRWLRLEQLVALQRRGESTQFAVVKEAIRRSVEGCDGIEYDLRLGLLLHITGQERLPFGALSDGQRNMIAMVGDLAFKAAQLNPHFGDGVLSRTPGIVLIDELDLHLHPRWQRHAVEDLRTIFPEIQFVATTHSPFIVQTMRRGELIPLDAQPVDQTANLTVEQIAAGLMQVDDGAVSPRYLEMKDKAKEYLLTLEQGRGTPPEKLAEFKTRLAEGIAPYADNPAYQAFLELKRVAALGE
jgi:predicted ATP-binding protein involved in virulence